MVTRTKSSGKATCRTCGAQWNEGTNVCHCASCHRTFTGLKGFDGHRSGRRHPHPYRPSGHCYDPADTGMVQLDNGQWSTGETTTVRTPPRRGTKK